MLIKINIINLIIVKLNRNYNRLKSDFVIDCNLSNRLTVIEIKIINLIIMKQNRNYNRLKSDFFANYNLTQSIKININRLGELQSITKSDFNRL